MKRIIFYSNISFKEFLIPCNLIRLLIHLKIIFFIAFFAFFSEIFNVNFSIRLFISVASSKANDFYNDDSFRKSNYQAYCGYKHPIISNFVLVKSFNNSHAQRLKFRLNQSSKSVVNHLKLFNFPEKFTNQILRKKKNFILVFNILLRYYYHHQSLTKSAYNQNSTCFILYKNVNFNKFQHDFRIEKLFNHQNTKNMMSQHQSIVNPDKSKILFESEFHSNNTNQNLFKNNISGIPLLNWIVVNNCKCRNIEYEKKSCDKPESKFSIDQFKTNIEQDTKKIQHKVTKRSIRRQKSNNESQNNYVSKLPWNKGKSMSHSIKMNISKGVKSYHAIRIGYIMDQMGIHSRNQYVYWRKKLNALKKKMERNRIYLSLYDAMDYGKFRELQVERRQKIPSKSNNRNSKLSELMKRRWMKPEFRDFMLTWRQERNFSVSQSTRNILAMHLKSRWIYDQDFKNNIISKLKLRIVTDEVRQKISLSLKRKWEDSYFRSKMLSKILYHMNDPGVRRKLSLALKKKWKILGFREKMLRAFSNRSIEHYQKIAASMRLRRHFRPGNSRRITRINPMDNLEDVSTGEFAKYWENQYEEILSDKSDVLDVLKGLNLLDNNDAGISVCCR